MREFNENWDATRKTESSRALALSASLTRRERSVLAALMQGHANKEIATALGCSVRTVEFHVANILHKHGVDTRARLIAYLLSTEHSSR
jgi:DNA-binding NarL/FixJ family response regulator